MTITPAMIKAVREQTDAGLAECKRALIALDGDVQGAIECILAEGRDLVFYYAAHERPMDNALLPNAQAHQVEHRIKRALAASTQTGRLNVPAERMGLVADLEGTYPDYARDEIAASIEASQVRRYSSLSNYALVQAPFVEALEELGVEHFKAYPVTLHHPASAREWPDFFILAFTRVLRRELLRDNTEPLFLDKEPVTCLYFNGKLKARLAQLGWEELGFTAHALPVCRAEPLDAGLKGDVLLLEQLAALFRDKRPRFAPGSRYDATYFIERLLERFSDVDFARIKQAIERSSNERFFYSEDATGCWLGARERS